MSDDSVGPLMTYRQLKDRLECFSDKELDQPIQILPPGSNNEEKAELHWVYAFDKAGELLDPGESRSSLDNLHHPEHWVLACDYCPYDEAGNMSYDLEDDLLSS